MSTDVRTLLDGDHISLDIEACGSVLLSVGAVHFDLATGESLSDFSIALDAGPQIKAGLALDAASFYWWLEQSPAARLGLLAHRLHPFQALQDLHVFCWSRELDAPVEPKRPTYIWAYPTSYDLPIIARVCQVFDVLVPWKWTHTLDARTLWKLACMVKPELAEIEKAPEPPDAHTALADARQQAGWIASYMAAFR